MKTRYIAICSAISLVLGIVIAILSIETIPSEPPENLPDYMTPIRPEVGKTTTPVGIYMIVASILVLIGTGIYSLVRFLKRRTRK
ncbi:MAG: hypothetical protein K5798_02905 [Nitrosopumilus sp.]|uniref:hypothetical protein n=1 Tax=Nitrosopumilus sp. TaxID=2024843 RepID=UPI00242D56D8|nr:hypothetical protein [Nitrosopumilus sp.]MCV0366200.1 hypothetical protein [Nitrosopumilus sp.]